MKQLYNQIKRLKKFNITRTEYLVFYWRTKGYSFTEIRNLLKIKSSGSCHNLYHRMENKILNIRRKGYRLFYCLNCQNLMILKHDELECIICYDK